MTNKNRIYNLLILYLSQTILVRSNYIGGRYDQIFRLLLLLNGDKVWPARADNANVKFISTGIKDFFEFNVITTVN